MSGRLFRAVLPGQSGGLVEYLPVLRSAKRSAYSDSPSGRSIQVWIPASIVCRRTQAEADDYARHCVEHADWEALDRQSAL